MFINNFDPVAFQIMSFEIRWYSLAYIAGIIIGWLLCKKVFIRKSDINEKFDDYITYLVIGIIIGGRLGYIIFYNFSYYINNFFDIFKVWEGGMSFHGGLIGIIVASILFSKKNIKKITSKEEFDNLSKRVENLENKIKKIEIKKRIKTKR